MRSLLSLLFILAFFSVDAQSYYRMTGDFSIKHKTATGKDQLTLGTFYYDMQAKQIVFDVRFPNKEIWVFKDTTHYIIQNDSVKQTIRSSLIAEFSVFHLSLKNQLQNYGLDNSVFSLDDVVKDGDMVISKWTAPKKMKMGDVAISTKQNKLFGVIFYNNDGSVMRKQFYKNYSNIRGVQVPGEVIDFFYREDEESIQKTEYRNVKVNDEAKNSMYFYRIPVH